MTSRAVVRTTVDAAIAVDGSREGDGDDEEDVDGTGVVVVRVSVGVWTKWVEAPGCVAVPWDAGEDPRVAMSAVPPPIMHRHPATPAETIQLGFFIAPALRPTMHVLRARDISV